MRRPTIRMPQLCAIARAEIEAAPRSNDAEWRERIKCRLVALGFSYPSPTAISDAMDRVERVLVKRWGARPV